MPFDRCVLLKKLLEVCGRSNASVYQKGGTLCVLEVGGLSWRSKKSAGEKSGGEVFSAISADYGGNSTKKGKGV